jgi:hypothetical protein
MESNAGNVPIWSKIKQEYKSKTNYNGKAKMIDVLQFCAAQCTHCYDACHLKKMDMSTVIMYNQDCADLCRLTAQLLEQKSILKNSFSDVRKMRLSARISTNGALQKM